MRKYIHTLVSEKGLDLEQVIEVQGESGTNFIPLGVVLEHIDICNESEYQQIVRTLAKIDFHNGDLMHFFTYLAKAIAK